MIWSARGTIWMHLSCLGAAVRFDYQQSCNCVKKSKLPSSSPEGGGDYKVSELESVRILAVPFFGRKSILTHSYSAGFLFQHFEIMTLSFQILKLFNSDACKFWYYQILTLANSDTCKTLVNPDTCKFWHLSTLSLSYYSDAFQFDIFRFWPFPILTLSNFKEKWTLTPSSMTRCGSDKTIYHTENFQFRNLPNSDTFKLIHFQILTLLQSLQRGKNYYCLLIRA